MKEFVKLIIEFLPPDAFQLTVEVSFSIVIGWLIGLCLIKSPNIPIIRNINQQVFNKLIFAIICVLISCIILLFLFGLLSTLLDNNINITSKKFLIPFINLVTTLLKISNSNNDDKITNYNIFHKEKYYKNSLDISTNNEKILIDQHNK